MSTKIFKRPSRSSKGPRTHSAGNYRGGRGRRPFHGQSTNRGGGRGRNQRGQYIDPTRFINKAAPTKEAAPYVAKHKFVDFEVADALKRNIIARKYDTPTPIQDQAIPHILAGSDLLGLANTGTGKTAAFLIPLIDRVLKKTQEQILIVTPTRELATQIEQELKAFTRGMKIYSVCAVGGLPIRRQAQALRYHNNFVIGTPGRLKDLTKRRFLNLSTFRTIVLDEADRMLDMGFIADIRFMLEQMPKERHTLFFSATLSPEIERLTKDFLKNPVRISVKTGDTAKNVDQDVVRIGKGNKFDILCNLVKQGGFDKVLVFGNTKHGVEKLKTALEGCSIKTESIHGDKNQSQRQKALQRFKDDHVQVLVATDVAARGLDISGVSHVINYDLPSTYDDYVHRIGRTGRGDKTGKTLTLIG